MRHPRQPRRSYPLRGDPAPVPAPGERCGDPAPGSYYPNPWVEAPPDSEPFNELGSIVVPAATGTETLVHQFRVPLKFDGVILGVLTQYVPGGLRPGSGDMIWRIRLGAPGVTGAGAGEPVRSYGAMTAEFGDYGSYHPVHGGGVQVRSNQYVSLSVVHAVGSPLPAGGNNLTVCAVEGYYWPAYYTPSQVGGAG